MQKFRSKIDWWILAFFIAMSGLLLQLLLTMYAKGTLSQNLLFAVVYALTIVLIWWPVLNTRYVIDKDTLLITCLFLKWLIPLSSIQKVTKTDFSISSPALSLDRLRIDYLKDGQAKFILLSPRNKEAFCQALNVTLQ